MMEEAAVETRRLRHQSAGLADINGSGSQYAENCGKVFGKEASSPKEACPCPRQLLEELSSTQDAVAAVSSETLAWNIRQAAKGKSSDCCPD